ncbi:class II aldolase/adducin family protein [Litoribrevibacter euphylliae]|uniref:Class II aldolase/adducin family protein n=1 Tax=Litoribrevibacter euphylliae TaxID=1834034 RepID=A0ABV7HLW4_9GAMM
MSEQEGVIKFSLTHQTLDRPVNASVLSELMVWRDLSRRLQWLGQDPQRYGGLGYGNISARESSQQFIISASQTSGVITAEPQHFARVLVSDLEQNHIDSEGMLPPSSESMTHAALYQCSDQVSWILHSHCPEIWQHSEALGLAATAAEVPYGTPEMAEAVQQLYRDQANPSQGIFVMKGHQDGVVSYGSTAKQAISTMLDCYGRALLISA